MEKLYIYKIRPEYARYLHNIDYRVSMKCEARPFVGIITMGSGVQYLLPLTSQTTSMRLAEGCRKRSSSVTTFIRDSNGEEIAEILHNNMIPVKDGLYIKMEISAETDTYESNEIRFFRKKHDNIISKAKKVYETRIKGEDPYYVSVCCDFERMETACRKFKIRHRKYDL